MAAAKSPSKFDQANAEAFADRFVTTLNNGALCLMVSVGHQTGLFDVMSNMKPATSEAIASESGRNERYVREWLGAMVTAGVVEVNPKTLEYSLPKEHGAFLTRAAGADNLAVFAQYIAELGSVEQEILYCFHHGGGVPYSKFPRFHEVMAEDSGQSVLSSLETHILPLIPGLVDRLKSGLRVLDVGCGRGLILIRLAELFSNSKFTGYDLSEEAIAFGRETAAKKGLKNLQFQVRDLSDFHRTAEKEAFDWVTTFDAVHDQARPLQVLKGIYRTLKPDGVYLMQDIKGSSEVHKNIDHPIGTLLYTISCMHCMTVSLAQGGEGLGAMWGEEKTREYLENAGFTSIVTNELGHDIQNNWYVVHK
ncbi:MAG: methyltransferase domain-containing protein [Deltaproteobacteria bacterium]|nr:methyltransferase domain-containing protein [Deltaproteobacteria bacterium]